MAKLTYSKRKRLRSTSFALSRERKYPIHDISHAKSALARVSAFGTGKEKGIVRRKVYKKFPSLRK